MKIKIVRNGAIIPTKGSKGAAGYDLYSSTVTPITVFPKETEMIPTGIAVKIPEGCFGGIYARSGLACKQGLRPANCVGVIDSDYTGEVMVAIHNDSNDPKMIEPGQRVAQLIVQKYEDITFEVVKDLDATERGSSGFGSTGE